MLTLGAYEKCRRYIEAHSRQSGQLELNEIKSSCPCITISRETGAGAGFVSQHLISYLQNATKDKSCEWTFFDKLLIEKVLADHNLPGQLSEFMKEDKYSNISSVVNELLGIHPSKWTLLHKTTETIIQLARMGNVVIVGRAANVITAKLPKTFHVRLVAPLENRVQKMMKHYSMSEKEAGDFIKREDNSRKNYVKSNFNKDIENPHLYHLVVNTGLTTYEEAARLIGHGVINKFHAKFVTKEAVLY
ncbi:MAG: cytidylate kinase-like family protein [Ignavibacteriales bacterium]|nr:cytidylate kinase-like family protein [Ignavibacteriales bacterium]